MVDRQGSPARSESAEEPAFAHTHDHDSFPGRHGNIVHVEGGAFTHPQGGVQQEQRDGAIPCAHLMFEEPHEALLFVGLEAAWRLLR